MRRRTVLRPGGALAAALAGCVGDDSPETRTATRTDDFASDPATVAPGGTVRWRNATDVGHTVTAHGAKLPHGTGYFASGGFDSEEAARERMAAGLVAPGEEYEHTFDVPGSDEYVCVPHEGSGMVGTVRVR